MMMPGRKYEAGNGYRYGFQSQETDKELWKGAISFEFRVEDPRLGRFFSVDPLSDDYPWNSPFAFAENRVLDGIELEGLEWKETKDKQGNVTDYNWVGFDRDGNAPKGTVESAQLTKGDFTFEYSSNAKDKSGHIDIMSNKKEVKTSAANVVTDYSRLFNYSIDLKPTGLLTQVAITTQAWSVNENFNLITGNTNTNVEYLKDKYGNESSKWITNESTSGSSGQSLFNGAKRSFGVVHSVPVALESVYLETILLPLPKGLNLLGKATGGAKQWLRLGSSFSKAGKFHTYGLRWGASPRYATKIGNTTLREINQKFRNWRIPYKSWRTADPGHFHFWKLK